MDEMGLYNFLWNGGFAGGMQNAVNGMFNTNVLNSLAGNNLTNAQGRVMETWAPSQAQIQSSQNNSNALIEQARQQANAMVQQAMQQTQQSQLESAAQKEIARLNAQAQLSNTNSNQNTLLQLEQLRQQGTQNRINGILPLLQSALGAVGGSLGGVSTNYGAGAQFQPSTQPSNAQAYRPMQQRPGQGGLLGYLNQAMPQRAM